ncbi:MAG: aldo/keto reductase [Anaerolineae bacterium]|jgi:predicted aldo/keto reductase-like oxidoreductase|nr:aldo/keto reductase [Anaerolineae bacterium]
MQYRTFGKTGYQISNLGFGAMRLPTLEDGTVDLEKGVPMLQRGIDLGINYIDTAYVYIKGTSEIAVGQAIKKYDRDKVYITTKIPSNKPEESDGEEWKRKLDESLKRFDTPYIDFILFHGLQWDSFNEHVSKPGHGLEVARKAQAEGLVKHVCFSSHDTPENIIKLIDTGEFEAVLLQYNYLDTHNAAAIERAHQAGLGVVVMGPIAGGRLVIPGEIKLGGEDALAVTTPELALRYVWSNPNINVALSGMNTMEMIEENVASAAKNELNSDENRMVQELVEKNKKLSDLYCTGCGYCMPCPNGVNIPENFRFMNWYKVWGMEEEAKKAYARFGEEGFWMPYGKVDGLNAEACIQCGECEPKCPQNIPIIDQLEETAAALGS